MRKKNQISLAKRDSRKQKQIDSYFVSVGAGKMKILYFELNGCGTENVAMATKFLTYFCLSQVFSSIC